MLGFAGEIVIEPKSVERNSVNLRNTLQQLNGVIPSQLKVVVDACRSADGLFASMDFLNSFFNVDDQAKIIGRLFESRDQIIPAGHLNSLSALPSFQLLGRKRHSDTPWHTATISSKDQCVSDTAAKLQESTVVGFREAPSRFGMAILGRLPPTSLLPQGVVKRIRKQHFRPRYQQRRKSCPILGSTNAKPVN